MRHCHYAILGGERTETVTNCLGHENTVIYFICPPGKGDNMPTFRLSSTSDTAHNPSTETAFCELSVTHLPRAWPYQYVFPTSSGWTYSHPVLASPFLQREHNTLPVSLCIPDYFSGSDSGSFPPVPEPRGSAQPCSSSVLLCARSSIHSYNRPMTSKLPSFLQEPSLPRSRSWMCPWNLKLKILKKNLVFFFPNLLLLPSQVLLTPPLMCPGIQNLGVI